MTKKRFSKDPKIEIITIDNFINRLADVSWLKIQQWKNNKRPTDGLYFNITSKYLVLLDYRVSYIGFGADTREILDKILVAYRDGESEYAHIDSAINELLKRISICKKKKHAIDTLERLEIAKRELNKIKYCEHDNIGRNKSFTDFLFDTKYQTSIEELKDKYVVIDVETNGIRRMNDDLLSISIYDPSSGKCYNRYFPLELQPMVLTGWINGIREIDLKNSSHFCQKELDELIDYFDLKHKSLLSFSGG